MQAQEAEETALDIKKRKRLERDPLHQVGPRVALLARLAAFPARRDLAVVWARFGPGSASRHAIGGGACNRRGSSGYRCPRSCHASRAARGTAPVFLEALRRPRLTIP